MDARRDWAFGATEDAAIHEEVWLLGQPPLGDYLSYVRKTVLGGDALNRAELVDEWRKANDRFYDLEENEAGFADGGEVRGIDPSLLPLAGEIRHDARFRRAFDSLPTRFAMVELDRLVVEQPHINLNHVERLKAGIASSPTLEDLFRFCLPLEPSPADVKLRRTGSKKFLFWSESSDFRFLEAVQLKEHQLTDFETYGPIGAIIGLVVGFGSNFLCAIESEKRLLLHNGHHRAYALRDLGITHAPCIVQTVTRRDELNLVASSDVADNPAFFFKAKRPPVLKDFFDPRLRKVFRVPQLIRAVEMSFEVRGFETRDFAAAD
jgi:hypothetical protein